MVSDTPPRRFPGLLGLVWLLGATLHAGAAGAQEARDPQAVLPLVTVVVTDAETHLPVPGAAVGVTGSGREVATDESGVALLERVDTGERTVMVRQVGYLPTRTALVVPPNATELIQVAMLPDPVEIAGIEVTARRESPLDRNGFYRRRLASQGTFFTREEIERARPATLTDLLRRVPGLSFSTTGAASRFGQTRASLRGTIGRACSPQVFVDGAQTAAFDLDHMPPAHLEGLEVYLGSATVPPAYNRGTAGCGVVLIWTRVGN